MYQRQSSMDSIKSFGTKFRGRTLAVTATAVAASISTIALPSLGSVYAKTVTPAAAWKQVTLNTQRATHTQMVMHETVAVTMGAQHEVLAIGIAATQQHIGKKVGALVNVTEVDKTTKQKQTAKLFELNNAVYQYAAAPKPHWVLVEKTKQPLVGQYVKQLYTHISMKRHGNNEVFTMAANDKELASMIQGMLSAMSTAKVPNIFQKTTSRIVVNAAKVGGNEKIKRLTASINIPTTLEAMQGQSTQSQSVTSSVYTKPTVHHVDIRVNETVLLTYKNKAVATPKGIAKK